MDQTLVIAGAGAVVLVFVYLRAKSENSPTDEPPNDKTWHPPTLGILNPPAQVPPPVKQPPPDPNYPLNPRPPVQLQPPPPPIHIAHDPNELWCINMTIWGNDITYNPPVPSPNQTDCNWQEMNLFMGKYDGSKWSGMFNQEQCDILGGVCEYSNLKAPY
jgi:hypothetical protein